MESDTKGDIVEIGEGEKRIGGKYLVKHTLGKGATCKVKLAFKNGKQYAVKIMNKDLDDNLKKAVVDEVNALYNIGKHPNIIRMKKYKSDGKYEKMRQGRIETERVDYMILEVASGGELFDFISVTGALNEDLARYFFK
jgi:serine/threonine protein kinase